MWEGKDKKVSSLRLLKSLVYRYFQQNLYK